YVQQELTDWNQAVINENGIETTCPRRAGLSSFGAGGANAHIVVEEYEEPVPQFTIKSQGPQIIVLSAKTEERLKVYAEEMLVFLKKTDFSLSTQPSTLSSMPYVPCLLDIAYTLQTGREAMKERLALIVSNIDELAEKLSRYCNEETEIEGLYKGNVKKNKANTELLVEGEEGSEFVKIIINNRRYNKLAQLWVSGVEL
ncbi:MAG: hypothetical protein GY861_01665, partial [bacterium]|nr:hypothetical protein [bacterium]